MKRKGPLPNFIGPSWYADLREFFKSAMAAQDMTSTIPMDRWDIEQIYSLTMVSFKKTMYTRFATFLDSVDEFDANIFKVPQNEALALDPQQRILMEEVGCAIYQASIREERPLSNFTGMQCITSTLSCE